MLTVSQRKLILGMAGLNKLRLPDRRIMYASCSLFVARSPYGGISINKKDYNAGKFLPGRRVYAQEIPETSSLPPDLDHNHLQSLDLHKTEPTWDKGGKETRNAYGGVIFNKHGQVLMIEPTNHFMGYVWTFPKGALDEGEHPVVSGLREVKEESGHDTAIFGLVPKRYKSPTGSGYAQYFMMRSKGQTSEPDWETAQTRWASPEEAHKLIDKTHDIGGRQRDHEILDTAVKHLEHLRDNPMANSYLKRPEQKPEQRQTYEKTNCNSGCGCNQCVVDKALQRVVYSRYERKEKRAK